MVLNISNAGIDENKIIEKHFIEFVK
jgi:hypothetical protein